MIYSNYTLTNGIRIIHKHSDSLVSHLGIIINAGSRDETETEQGIAHFIEHTIFKGTKKRKSYQVLCHMENVGGEINAFTTKEDTCVYTSFMNKFLDRAADLLADITFHSTFPEKELEKEKEVVLDEINSYRDNPSEEIFDEFEKLILAHHSIGRYILGEASIIKKFRKQHLLHFMKRCYNTNEMVICSVGNTDFAQLVKIIEKYFSSFKSNNRDWKRNKFKRYKPFYTEVSKPIHQSHCIIGNTAYHSKDKRRAQMIMLNNILGGPGMNSKLSMNIREKYGFCYNIESSYTSFTDAGIFCIYLGHRTREY